jgi:hypothetical protein
LTDGGQRIREQKIVKNMCLKMRLMEWSAP